jgi:hypothetical protein
MIVSAIAVASSCVSSEVGGADVVAAVVGASVVDAWVVGASVTVTLDSGDVCGTEVAADEAPSDPQPALVSTNRVIDAVATNERRRCDRSGWFMSLIIQAVNRTV